MCGEGKGQAGTQLRRKPEPAYNGVLKGPRGGVELSEGLKGSCCSAGVQRALSLSPSVSSPSQKCNTCKVRVQSDARFVTTPFVQPTLLAAKPRSAQALGLSTPCQMCSLLARCGRSLPDVSAPRNVWALLARCGRSLPGVASACKVWTLLAKLVWGPNPNLA
eukprot:365425-Chlamydomonas_euryale.AAC.1